MSILITGEKGFIGSHLVKVFPDARGYDLITGFDIRNTDMLETHLRGIDTVIHLAALVSVEESKRQPKLYVDTNIKGTASVIEAAIKAGVKKIVYASSAACYEPESSPYAMSKLAAEHLMQNYREIIKTVCLRFFNIYGVGQNPNYGAVITSFQEGLKQGEIKIYGDGKHTRDFISIKDVIRAIQLAVTIDDYKSGTVFDIGTGKQTQIIKLAGIMADIMKVEPKINFQPFRKEVEHSVAMTEPARIFLRFKSEIPLEDGLKELLI